MEPVADRVGDELWVWIGSQQLTGHISNIAAALKMDESEVHVISHGCGGGYGDAAQHSQCLYGLFAHVPGLKVVVPSNAYDAKGLMISAIRDDNPVMYFFHKGIMGLPWMQYFEGATTTVPAEPYTLPFGQAAVAVLRARTVRRRAPQHIACKP